MPLSVKVRTRNITAVTDQLKVIDYRLSRPFSNKRTTEAVMGVYADHATDMLGSQGRGNWPRLNPRYAAWKNKVRPGRPMLVFDGTLSRALTDINNRRFKAQTKNARLTLWPDVPYAAAHQAGLKTKQRKFIDLRQQDANNIGRAVLGGAFRGLHNIL